jgi:hypothetical protein
MSGLTCKSVRKRGSYGRIRGSKFLQDNVHDGEATIARPELTKAAINSKTEGSRLPNRNIKADQIAIWSPEIEW